MIRAISRDQPTGSTGWRRRRLLRWRGEAHGRRWVPEDIQDDCVKTTFTLKIRYFDNARTSTTSPHRSQPCTPQCAPLSPVSRVSRDSSHYDRTCKLEKTVTRVEICLQTIQANQCSREEMKYLTISLVTSVPWFTFPWNCMDLVCSAFDFGAFSNTKVDWVRILHCASNFLCWCYIFGLS